MQSSLRKLNDNSEEDRRRTRQYLIRDLRMKKPRADLEAAIRAAGGTTDGLTWLSAAEEDKLRQLRTGTHADSKTHTVEQVRAIRRPCGAASLELADIEGISDVTVLIEFGRRENTGTARIRIGAIGANLVPFLDASVERVSLTTEYFSSSLTVERQYPGEPVDYYYSGDAWSEVIDELHAAESRTTATIFTVHETVRLDSDDFIHLGVPRGAEVVILEDVGPGLYTVCFRQEEFTDERAEQKIRHIEFRVVNEELKGSQP